MKPLFILSISFLLYSINNTAFTQEVKRCAYFQLDSIYCKKFPQRALNKIDFENKIINYLINNQRSVRVSSELIRIAVVVHIIHTNLQGIIGGPDNTNISDEQICSQIKVLNEDYRKKPNTLGYNTNSVGADMEMEFFLSTRDSNGNPSKGITRTYSSQDAFNLLNDEDVAKISNLAHWDSNRFLNIWVCDISGGYLGFSAFPGTTAINGLETDDVDEKIDGVYIDYRAFGRRNGTSSEGLYSYGRTATHEIGHFFGLIHTWGDTFCGTDHCDDTPASEKRNLDFCADVFSTCSGVRTRNMIENYMDYTPDSCMNIFTQDQKNRMRAVMNLSVRRRKLINYAKSLDLSSSSTLNVTVLPNPAITNITLQILFADFQDFKVDIYDSRGSIVYSQSYTDFPSTVIELSSLNLPDGEYIIKVSTLRELQIKRIAYLK